MNAFIKNYNGPYLMAKVARDETILSNLKQNGIDSVYFDGEKIYFSTTDSSIILDSQTRGKLQQLNSFDIIEISPNGLLFRPFSYCDGDATLFMGNSCNSNCIMCPASEAERRNGACYEPEYLFKYIDYLPEGIPNLVITGGEPTMKADLFLEALKKVQLKFKNTYVLLLTNGRSSSCKAFANQIYENAPNLFQIAIPVHGHCPTLHDSITRVPGSFEQTIKGISNLLSLGINIEIRVVVTKLNCKFTMDIAKLIVKEFRGIKTVNFIGLEPLGNCALNFEKVFINYEDSFKTCRDAVDYLVGNGFDVSLYNYPLCSIDKGYWAIAKKSISGYKNAFPPECETCDVRTVCGGFFDSALRFAKPAVKPYKEITNYA